MNDERDYGILLYILTPTGHGLLSLLQQLSVIFLIFVSLLLLSSLFSHYYQPLDVIGFDVSFQIHPVQKSSKIPEDTHLFLRDLRFLSNEYGRRAVERRIVGAAGLQESKLNQFQHYHLRV